MKISGWRLKRKRKKSSISRAGIFLRHPESNCSARVFQVTRCSACGAPLDLPTVHFMCKHSFHQRFAAPVIYLLTFRCLPDIDDPECPQCAKENATIRDLRNQQDEWAERQDLFRSHLRDSDDKFGVVANWFGKGVMNSIKLVDT